MNFLKAGGLLLLCLFALAIGLRIAYPPVPREIETLKVVSGDLEAGHLVFNTRLPAFKNAWLQALGAPNENPETVELVRAYVDAIQQTEQKVDVVISGSSTIDRAIKGVQHMAIAIDTQHLPNLFQGLHELHARNLKILLIMGSGEASHRMFQSTLTYFEDQFSMQIPTVIIAGLAFNDADERLLTPPCEGNPFTEQGHVIDLGCNILALSRRAQIEKPALDHYLVSIEEESADEELVAIFRPSR